MGSTEAPHPPAAGAALALELELNVLDWGAWGPGREAKPEARWVPSLLRRRAGPGDRLALEAAGPLAGSGPLPGVFASRHGQIIRSVDLLEALARGEPPSPMDFSLSVHNATAGLWSMARQDRSAFSALAAGRESLGAALLEAQGLLAEGAPKVLAVFHDEAPPAVLDAAWDREPTGWALALLLGGEGEGPGRRLDLRLWDAPGGAGEDPRPQAQALAGLLERGSGEERWAAGRHIWAWGLRA